MVKPGDKFGRLTAVSKSGRAADGHFIWLCLCDCGKTCTRQSNNLQVKRKHGVSCGCVAASGLPGRTHGGRNTREYRQWTGAKARCHTPTNKDYRKYGGRGIEMCARWRDSFETFLADMGQCPPRMSLDRINVNGPYSRENCRWATDSQQQLNRRDSYVVVAKGQPFSGMTAAAEHFGVSITTIIRWCDGFYDARRHSFTEKRADSYRTRVYR